MDRKECIEIINAGLASELVKWGKYDETEVEEALTYAIKVLEESEE